MTAELLDEVLTSLKDTLQNHNDTIMMLSMMFAKLDNDVAELRQQLNSDNNGI